MSRPVIYDVIIVGSGPTGLSAAIHTAQYDLKVVVLESSIELGGLARMINFLIRNYPGFPEGISGPALINKFVSQAKKYKVKFRTGEEVTDLLVKKNMKVVMTPRSKYLAKSIILATGSAMQGLGIKGETWFGGGIFYCEECCRSFLYDKSIVVIGSSPEAVKTAIELKNFATQITIVDYNCPIPFTSKEREKLKKNNILLIEDFSVTRIEGDPGHKLVILKNHKKKDNLEADCIFIDGSQKNIIHVLRRAGIKTHKRGCIVVDECSSTNVKGVFAAGACTSVLKDIIPPCVGDGAKTAAAVWLYLTKQKE